MANPAATPEFSLGNYTHFERVEHKVKLYQSVLDHGATAVPLGQGQETALIRYAIDRFIQRYKARFAAEPVALGGTLAFENKKNFQVQFLKCLEQGLNPKQALKAAVIEISYGKHRAAAGYGNVEVDTGPPASWVTIELANGKKSELVPTIIKIIARKST